jgi:hypothetical protein
MRNLIINLILLLAILFVVRFVEATTIKVTYVIHSQYSKSSQSSSANVLPTKGPKVLTTPALGRLSVLEQKVYEATCKTFSCDDWEAMKYIISHESGFNPLAVNASSGACGIGQALPCEKMGCQTLEDVDCQINWMFKYIKERYKDPQLAYQFWIEHSWY